MSFKDDLIKVLSGGLPTLLEFPDDPASATTIPTIPVEQIQPEPQLKDTESFLMGVTQNQIGLVTVGVIGLIAAVLVFKKI